MISTIVTIPGFVLLCALMDMFGIYEYGKLAIIAVLIVGSLIYSSIVYRIIIALKGPNSIYAVDTSDPTVLERKKRSK